MKKLLPLLGVTVACGACCAIPLLLPIFAGLAASGAGAAMLGWETGLAMVAGATVVAALLWIRRARLRAATVPSSGGACGCTEGANGECK